MKWAWHLTIALIALSVAIFSAGSNVIVLTSSAVELPGTPIERYSAAHSTVETVGPSSKNLKIWSRALNLDVSQTFNVAVTARAVNGPAGRPTATLLEASGGGTAFVVWGLGSVARTTLTQQTVSVYAKQGPDHDGSTTFWLRVFVGSTFYAQEFVPTADWSRVSVEIPDTEASTDVKDVYIWPSRTGSAGTEPIYVDDMQIEDGSLSAFESTGGTISETQVGRIVDTTGNRSMVAEGTFDSATFETVDGIQVIRSPSGRESWLERDPILGSAQSDWPHNGGITCAVLFKGGIQYGTGVRLNTLSNPWQVILRDNSLTNVAFQVTDTVGVKAVSKSGLSSGWQAAVLVVEQGSAVTLYVNGDTDNPVTTSIGTLTTGNNTESKQFGGSTDTGDHMYAELIWYDTASTAVTAGEIMDFFKAEYPGVTQY